ncbi:MAG: polyphosphate kinase 2 family protein [Hyphomonadaceae bacterium]|nr:polyphosphate kinase 2 family protein [Hyphomonadaceae bacterium]MBX3510011.1 polyphosphate kinase 2 family protein [Hyphomonadaceae bacterium]
MDYDTLDHAIRIAPKAKAPLKGRDPLCEHLFPDKQEAEEALRADAKAIDAMQDVLWAERKRALLVVLQGIDTSGKDGTVRGVFNSCGPLGVAVTAFGKPSEEELSHDYLWRVHKAVPKRGMIGVFNRSHYEDVLVVKVRGLAPAAEVERRYEQINAFEKHLTENGVTVLKFMLHISKDEQRKRLQERLDDPKKHWKFNPGDLEDRALWDDYVAAYDTMLERCSTAHAPWRVTPADKKWRRNAIISAVVRRTLEEMNPAYPKAEFDPKAITIE